MNKKSKFVSRNKHSIYEIIECLHNLGKNFNSEKDYFLNAVLNRDFLELYLKQDVFSINMLDYFCYDFKKDLYVHYSSKGELFHHLQVKTWRQGFLDLIFGILYKNINHINYDKQLSEVMTKFLKIFKKENSSIFAAYIGDITCKLQAANSIRKKDPLIVIEERFIKAPDLADIKNFLKLQKNVQVFILGKNIIEGHKQSFATSKIKEFFTILQNRSKNGNNIGFFANPELVFQMARCANSYHNLIDLTNMPLPFLYASRPEVYSTDRYG